MLKTITEFKNKISEKDVYDTYTRLGDKYSNAEIKGKTLEHIKNLDKKISNFELDYVKKLYMANDHE